MSAMVIIAVHDGHAEHIIFDDDDTYTLDRFKDENEMAEALEFKRFVFREEEILHVMREGIGSF